MQHYFIDKEHFASDFFEFNDEVLGYNLTFKSCDSIFSKNKIDDGTRALLSAIKKHCVFAGLGLDLGCGLGPIGITIIKLFGVDMHMVDVNATAVKLAHENTIKNNVQKQTNVYLSNGFKQVNENFDFIVSNPPIKTGKKLLFELMDGCFGHLKNQGQLVVVIRKDLGMESLKNYLLAKFNNCEILERDKGYYILKSVKN